MVVLCVTLNPAVDRVLVVDHLEPVGTVRPREVHVAAGGKGNNVARALRLLGTRVVTTGVVAGLPGEWLVAALRREGLQPRFLTGGGETRTTCSIVHPGGTVVLAEPGPPLDDVTTASLLHHYRALVSVCEFVVIAGSVPSGAPGLIEDLVEAAGSARCPVLVDSSDDALGEACAAGADIVKANLEECVGASLVGANATASSAALALVAAGARAAVVTDGPRGAAGATGDSVLEVPALALDVRSTVGAGDAFTAGLVAGILDGGGFTAGLRRGTAAAAACCLVPGAGWFDPNVYSEMLSLLDAPGAS